ncbi:MAG TPA: hypothetical protein DCQ98_20795, partial [Planctomycetaceae bacterium]|nr:hypothetical protein [Planctomycetaceae bacterium]HRE99117.1 cellulose synthase operon protein YhjQ/BcsQ [Pirellulaceae bacterium]
FRLDHGDWMPTPHNPQLFVAPSGPAIAGEANRTTIDASETIARSETTVEMRNESRPHETMASLAPQIATSPIVVASRGDVRGEEHRAAASSAPASTATKASEAIAPRPAWEVDDFRWPTLTTELLLSQGTIFDRLLKALRERNDSAKVLGVTGSRSGDGRSTLAICLARWSASQGHRTLLVDGDLLRGSLAFAAGVDFDRGWSDLEGQGLPVGEGLIRSAATPLTLLPLDPRRLDEGEYHRSARRLDTLLAELRPHFDWIVVDSGTAEELARFHLDAIPSLDAAVVVRNLQVTTPQELEAAQRHLVGIGIRQLAVAENFGRRKAG